jgi:adenylosuccinate synthase
VPVTAIVGANWGDEGKGKITDLLAENADIVVRFQGGDNAGHTIINPLGKFVVHSLPSGIFYPHVVNLIGPGVALNPESLFKELDGLLARGIPKPQLKISSKAQLVLPYHVLFDRCEEERLQHQQFGSTRRGIAPFYSEKYLKVGIRVEDLLEVDHLRTRLEGGNVRRDVLLKVLYDQPPVDVESVLELLSSYWRLLEPYVCDSSELLWDGLDSGKRVLLEGQLGALRDPDHGIYPFSTSSSPLAGFASVGAGVPPHEIREVIAVVKAYSSCVGAGPFVSELLGAESDELRRRGGSDGEYGATTGRPRRVGWFDCVASRYGCKVQGATKVALSLLDVLGYLPSIKICTAYRVDRKVTHRFSSTAELLRAEPVLEELPGWQTDLRNVRRFGDLPENAQRYVARIEEELGVPITWISVGPERSQYIERSPM